jgi:diguanylate cyclase (GGDEF)-like protein
MTPDSIISISYLNRSLFLIINITLLYVFLKSRRSIVFQAIAFITTWLAIYALRLLIRHLNLDPLLDSYIMGSLYLIPCMLIFRETYQAKIFIFYMIYSLTQFTYLVFMYADIFFSPALPQILVMAGMALEMASLPLIRRCLRKPVRDIIGIINRHNPVFTLFPILSFILLASFAIERQFTLLSFISLMLTTSLIFFSYYMTAIAISSTRRQQELEFISRTDSLTGLFNRRHIEDKIREEFIRYERMGMEFALVTADIDFFKKINDTHGHDCGDYLLKAISEDLRKSVRTYDTVARWGGEEFMILLPGADSRQAQKLAERIRKTVEARRYSYGNKRLRVTLTLGVSVVRSDDTIQLLTKRADLALYQGKSKGRNRVILSDDEDPASLPL